MLQRGERGKKKNAHTHTHTPTPCPAKTLTMTAFINTVALQEQSCLEFHK